MLIHQPVLLKEVIEGLAIKPDGYYVDTTFGRGGHAAEILDRLSEQGRLLAMDKDPEAVVAAMHGVFKDPRLNVVHSTFSQLESVVATQGWQGNIAGVLMDLGVSSPQLDDPDRGFSFMRDGPLDMRMNPTQGLDAATWINRAKESEIATVLYEYGEERYSRRIAKAIVKARAEEPFSRTLRLAQVIRAAHPAWEAHQHPATRSFQAIRIFINSELDELKTALEQSLNVLSPGGRLCVISFHSLEDRIIKKFMQKQAKGDPFPPDLPVQHAQLSPTLRLLGSQKAHEDEVKNNPRARSARLRIAEKIA